MNIEIIILTPIDIEYQAICQHCRSIEYVSYKHMNYALGQIEIENETHQIAIRRTGSKNENLSIETLEAVHYFNPSYVFLTGIAGGVKDVKLGDIVVGTKAYGYESGKITKNGYVSRPEVIAYSSELIDKARVINQKGHWRNENKNTLEKVKIHFGPIASGNKVIANTQHDVFITNIKKHYNDTLAIEMEAIGFAKVSERYAAIQFMNIRGISDLLDNKTATDAQGMQEVAAAHAAAFTLELISDLITSSNKKTTHMDVKKMARTVVEMVFPFMKIEAVKQIGKELTEATNETIREIWNKVRPIFIEDIEDMKQADENEIKEIEGSAVTKFKRHLKDNPDLKNELEVLLGEVKGQDESFSQTLNNINNYGTVNSQIIMKDHYGDITM